MKTKELIRTVEGIMGPCEGIARDAIETALAVIVDELAEGGEVKLSGVGTLSVRRRLPRLQIMPGTGLEVSVKGPRVAKFSASKLLEMAINLREVG